jgi:hypothetical protein
MLGFKNFESASNTIAGVELLRRIYKRQFALGRLGLSYAGLMNPHQTPSLHQSSLSAGDKSPSRSWSHSWQPKVASRQSSLYPTGTPKFAPE